MNLLSPYSFGTNELFEFADEAITLQRNNRLRQSGYDSTSDETLKPLESALRTLSDQHVVPLAQKLLFKIPKLGWADAEVSTPSDANGENHCLVVLSALCRVGVFTQENGCWRRTWFGNRLASRLPRVDFYAFIRGEWTEPMWEAYLTELDWAWDALGTAEVRECFDRVIEKPTGFSHEELPQPEKVDRDRGREIALKAVAAAAAVGAVWFSGWSWMPTLYGTWLSNHPKSPLNASTELLQHM